MTKASKNTFIDQIVTVNKKKDYPIPGPGSAFFDKKSARLVEEDKRELLIMKESTKATKKHNTSQAARTMSFINEKYQKTMPGPGTYPKLEENGKAAPPKKPKEHMKYADFKKSLEEMKKKEKDKMRAEEERIKEMKAKIGMPEKELPPLPLPVDLPLFDRVIKQYGDLKVRMKARAMAKPKGRFQLKQKTLKMVCVEVQASAPTCALRGIVSRNGRLRWRTSTRESERASSSTPRRTRCPDQLSIA